MTPELKQRLVDLYNRKIVAGWYKSAALIAGWIVSGAVFLPDLIQFVFDHWDLFGSVLLPRLSPEAKATILALYLTFGAPPLRAWQQRSMQVAALKQAALTGNITTRVGLDAVIVAVPGTFPQMVRPDDNG
jgi:hypothetical protein